MANAIDNWSERQFDRHVRNPFWKSTPFLMLAALFAIAETYGIWIGSAFWGSLPGHARFALMFIVVTAPLALLFGIQQQRFLRHAGIPHDAAKRVSVLTFAAIGWSYALMIVALRLVLSALRQAG